MKPPLLFLPYSPSAADTTYHNVLPHRSRECRTVFVTWRLSDSLPPQADFLRSLRREQHRWLKRKGLPFCPWSQDVDNILLEHYPNLIPHYRRIQFRAQERFDRQRLGSCALKHPAAIRAVRQAMAEEDDVGIGDHVICFNHVHLLMVLGKDGELKRHIERIKGRASRYLGLAEVEELPRPIWQRYAFDHMVRSMQKLDRIRKYIADHPVPCDEAHVSAEWIAARS